MEDSETIRTEQTHRCVEDADGALRSLWNDADDACWIFLADSVTERHPSFVEAVCMAVSFATGFQVNPHYEQDGDLTGDGEETVASIRAFVKALKEKKMRFTLLWQGRGGKPELDHSEDHTAREAWKRIIDFLQHDMAWTIGDLVG